MTTQFCLGAQKQLLLLQQLSKARHCTLRITCVETHLESAHCMIF